MRDMQVILWCLFQLFLFLLAIKLLAMAKLLPLMLYLVGANTIFPDWVAGQPLAYYGIAALLLLLLVAYWLMRYRQHRQEERFMLGRLLATAKPLYGPGGYYTQPPAAEAEAKEMEAEPEPGTDEWYDYWYDR